MNQKETAKERQRQIERLLAVSTLAERRRIRKARREGRRLQRQAERL